MHSPVLGFDVTMYSGNVSLFYNTEKNCQPEKISLRQVPTNFFPR